MNIKELKDSGKIIYEVISGSHAYGTANKDSDIDIRGIFVHDNNDYLNVFEEPEPQISDETNDTTYFSLKRAFELLSSSNPNIIELLWMPDDCIRYKNDSMNLILENRHIFISKKCFETHSGYAFAQIKRAKGANKKVHNPQAKDQPKKEDFCWVIPFNRDVLKCNSEMPCRPIPLKEMKFLDSRKLMSWDLSEIMPNGSHEFNSNMDLSQFHVSSVEHSHNVYRLYYYAEKSNGVFRGDDMLVCESIPKDDENKCVGLLIYNKDGYNKALKDWHSYWDWMKFRNSARWIDQEKGNLDYDQKNMMHCVRLLMSGENILINGEPIVRFKGDQLDYLMKIRNGQMKYEEIMDDVEHRMSMLQEMKDKSKIQENIETEKVEELYRIIINNI